MTLELLEDMESLNTKGKTWRKGQLVELNAKDGQTLIDSGKAQLWTPPPPPPPPPPKTRIRKPNAG